MTGSADSTACCVAPSSGEEVARIDRSCRWPTLALFAGAAVWLLVSTIFGLVASLKFHSPNLLADYPALSYGRAYAVWGNVLVYGFAVPAALAFAAWMIARLGRVPLRANVVATVGAALWHLGVLVGLLGLLAGQTSGYEWFEFPRTAALLLGGAFLLISLPVFLAHAVRRERALQPAQWFSLAGLFWFAWIFSTAVLVLHFFPPRGVAQAAVAWWYGGNLLAVWLGLSGLAITFYLLPKLTQRPLQSGYLALFAFWNLILFGAWTGIQGGAALPAWMPALSGAATLLLLVPALALATCVYRTSNGAPACARGELCFVKAGAWSLVIALGLLAVTGNKAVSRVTDFTWYGSAHVLLRLYGFFALTAFAAAYHLLPRVTGLAIASGRIRLHYWLAMPGALLLSLPLAIGGIQQGLKLMDAKVEFMDAANAAMMMFRLTSIGDVLFGVGALLFAVNVFYVTYRAVRTAAIQLVQDEPVVSGSEVRA
jgi:cytochrome c oxidase cbb3-type subunit I